MFKTCTLCGIEKPFSEFHKRVRSKDGYAGQCKSCVSEQKRIAYAIEPEKFAKRNRANYLANSIRIKENFRARYERESELLKTRIREYWERNPQRRAALNAKRRSAELQATPTWANHEAIALIYEEAQFATEFFGVTYHVDHMVPLQGKTVCGLHWEGNLQVIEATPNLKKSNRRWPDMP